MTLELTVTNTSAHSQPNSSTMPFARHRMVEHWLLRFVIGLGMITALLGCLAVGLGHIQPTGNTATAIGLGWCGDIPCFNSFIPGQTWWRAQFAAFDEQQPDNPYHLSLSASIDGSVVGTVVIPMSATTQVLLGDIVKLYGVPCRVDVTFYWQWGSVILHYHRLHVLLSHVDMSGLRPSTSVSHVTLIDPASYPSRFYSDPCAINPPSPSVSPVATIQRHWHGFTTLQHYLTDSS